MCGTQLALFGCLLDEEPDDNIDDDHSHCVIRFGIKNTALLLSDWSSWMGI